MRALLLLLLVSPVASAAEFGVAKVVKGRAILGTDILKEGDTVHVGDVITTGPRSFVRIVLREGIAMQVGPDSTIRLDHDRGQPTTINLVKGILLSKIRKSEDASVKYRVKTRAAAMGVRGTTFFVRDEDDGRTFLCVCMGRVESRWDKGKKDLSVMKHTHFHISGDQAATEDAPMGSDHTDEEIAELDRLLR